MHYYNCDSGGMASKKKNRNENQEMLSLHDMFRIIGDQLTPTDVRVLQFLYAGLFPDVIRTKFNDGYTFLLALEKIGQVDSSNFKHILHLLRIVNRHDLTQFVTLKRRTTGESSNINILLNNDLICNLLSAFAKSKYTLP